MNVADYIKKSFSDYFNLTPYLMPQEEAEEEIRAGVSFKGTNIVILMMAIMIASLGLNTNSTAVIIGAMLISPLMGPIIGMGLAVGVADFELLKRAGRNLAAATAVSVAASTIYFLISPVNEGHSELLARTSPTIYDVMIGFFGGGAGIVALGSRSRGNVIPGVAIATALMPPLCTAGYGLATMQMHYFLGAFYLFIINSIFIGLATFIGVKLMHYHPIQVQNQERARRIRRIVYGVALVTILPSIYLTYTMLREARFEMDVSRFVAAEFQFPATTVVSSHGTVENGQRVIDVTLIGKPLPTDSLRLAMSSRLGYYGLAGAELNIIQGADQATAAQSAAMTTRQVYDMAQGLIARKDNLIDSLRTIIVQHAMADSVAARLLPELRVVFPSVRDIAVERAVFAGEGQSRLDTVNVALIHFANPITVSRRNELERYLMARLRLKAMTIIDVTHSEIENTKKVGGEPS